jgi:serine acetyltransferase
VGSEVTVGAGAVVTADVADGATVVSAGLRAV